MLLVPPLYDKIADLEATFFQVGKHGDVKARLEPTFTSPWQARANFSNKLRALIQAPDAALAVQDRSMIAYGPAFAGRDHYDTR